MQLFLTIPGVRVLILFGIANNDDFIPPHKWTTFTRVECMGVLLAILGVAYLLWPSAVVSCRA
jgi:hypothetical protein